MLAVNMVPLLSSAVMDALHSHKVDEVIVPEAATRKARLLLYRYKHALAFQEVRDQSHFAEPAGR